MFFISLGRFFYSGLLLVNAVTILSEDRFLARINMTPNRDPGFGADPEGTVSSRLIKGISAMQTVLRAPLIFANILIVFYELILG